MPSKPTTIFSFHHKLYYTLSISIYAFKTHHNLQFSPRTLLHTFNKYLCLQNPLQSSVFTTNSTTHFQYVSMPSKPTTIFSFHHKLYYTFSISIYYTFSISTLYLCLQYPPQSSVFIINTTTHFQYAFKIHHNLLFSPQILLHTFSKYLCV